MKITKTENGYELDGVSIKVEHSSSGSIDPWTYEYAAQKRVGLVGTSDIGLFTLIGEHIYKLDNISERDFIFEITNRDFTGVEELLRFVETIGRDFGMLSEEKKRIDEMKVINDMLKKMTDEERREYFKKKREERKLKENK